MSIDQLELLLRLKSPHLASSLAYVPCAPRGWLSRDALLTRYAQERLLPTTVLEDTDEIDARRAALPNRLYEHSLRYIMRTNKSELYDFITDAMNRGDEQVLLGLVTRPYEHAADAELFTRVMIDERNLLWARRLVPILDRGNAVIAVGAAHLPGPRGVITLLRRSGYQVVPSYVDALR